MRHAGIGVRLPFRWEEDGDLIRATYRKYVPGLGLVERPNWPILDQRGTTVKSLFPRVGMDGMLLGDLLLITKIPSYLTVESYQSGRAIVSIAGAHGTGTRAISVLLRSRKQMAEIGAEIEKYYQSFQVLLEVGDIRHDPERGSRARRVVWCVRSPTWTTLTGSGRRPGGWSCGDILHGETKCQGCERE
jgi:hypothetical protein